MSDLITRLLFNREATPEKIAIGYIQDPTQPKSAIGMSYEDFVDRSEEVAGWLACRSEKGSRAMIVMEPGLDFAVAFIACMMAGVIAVPAPVPGRKKSAWDRLTMIIENADADLLLTGATPSLETERMLQYFSADKIGIIERIHGTRLPSEGRILNGDDIAFLQYTSGSTGTPRGVIVTHNNIMANEHDIQVSLKTESDAVMVGWLPHYHDMGLIGQILHPLYLGATVWTMSPMAFVKRPWTWLHCLSQKRATLSVAPNFAFALAVDRITDEQCKGLDLSVLDLLLNGAEPIDAVVLNKFVKKFSPYGLKEDTIFPCYGLAESTLFVSGQRYQVGDSLRVDRLALQTGMLQVIGGDTVDRAEHLVACGAPPTQKLRIANIDDGGYVSDGIIGEVIIKGASVTSGYWRENPLDPDRPEHPIRQDGYLQTGDLGAMFSGSLYLTGRIKDLIIVNGRNIYSQDIERMITRDDSRIHSCVAVDANGSIFILAESTELEAADESERTEVERRIRRTVSVEYGATVSEVKFVKLGVTPKTTSGKVQRHAVRESALSKGL